MQNPKYQIFTGKKGQHFFRLKAKNGQVVLSSESYKSKSAAKDGIRSVKRNGIWDSQFDRRASKDGQFYFTLKARNNEVIGRSERYKSKSGMENGIKAVMNVAGIAPVEDLTD